MSYRIEYHKPEFGGHMRLTVLTAMCLMFFMLLVYWQWPEGAALIRTVLLAVERSVGVTALEGAAEALKAGKPVAQTFSDFLSSLRS